MEKMNAKVVVVDQMALISADEVAAPAVMGLPSSREQRPENALFLCSKPQFRMI